MRFLLKARVWTAGLVILTVAGIASPASATVAVPTIRGLGLSPSTVTVSGSRVTVAADVSNATRCTLSAKPTFSGLPVSFSCGTGKVKRAVVPPANHKTKAGVKYTVSLTATGAGGSKTATVPLVVALEDTLTRVKSVASSMGSTTRATNGPVDRGVVNTSAATYGTFCALAADGTVDCWGDGESGALGDDSYDSSDTAVQVVGVGGSGVLSDVASIVGNNQSFCALLDTANVDCWGAGIFGDLGDGVYYPDNPGGNDVPVQVVGVGDTGLLSGVTSISSDGADTYCAILDTSEVDCWGSGAALGDGVAYPNSCSTVNCGDELGSDVPVQVLDPDGVDLLTGVQSITGGVASFCAILASSGVDCWGNDYTGQNGDGTFQTTGDPDSFTPTAVEGVGGVGLLSGVTSLASDSYYSFCAELSSGGVDCWGWGGDGELGNDVEYPGSGSGTPVQVVSLDGSTTLSGIATVVGGLAGFCAVTTAGNVDCWGSNWDNSLGNGVTSVDGGVASDMPVSVVDTSGSGQLSGVTGLVGGELNYCATLDSGGLDCWGEGGAGELGDGITYDNPSGIGTPVQVIGGVNGPTLAGVQQVVTAVSSGNDTFCALFGSADQIACWGVDDAGELGDGNTYPQGFSDTPVDVVAP